MWHVATKKHEAFKGAIFKALTYLAEKVSLPELNFLFQKVKSLPLRDHDKFSLELLKAIAKKLAPTQKTSSAVHEQVKPVRRVGFSLNDDSKLQSRDRLNEKTPLLGDFGQKKKSRSSSMSPKGKSKKSNIGLVRFDSHEDNLLP